VINLVMIEHYWRHLITESLKEKITNCKPPLWRSVSALVGLLILILSL